MDLLLRLSLTGALLLHDTPCRITCSCQKKRLSDYLSEKETQMSSLHPPYLEKNSQLHITDKGKAEELNMVYSNRNFCLWNKRLGRGRRVGGPSSRLLFWRAHLNIETQMSPVLSHMLKRPRESCVSVSSHSVLPTCVLSDQWSEGTAFMMFKTNPQPTWHKPVWTTTWWIPNL